LFLSLARADHNGSPAERQMRGQRGDTALEQRWDQVLDLDRHALADVGDDAAAMA
jgi:hypothetical protein